MKTCKICNETKGLTNFTKYAHSADGVHTKCRECLSKYKAQDYKDKWFVYQARLKKAECKKKGLPFNLTPEYLESIWTTYCPVFGEEFVCFDKTSDRSPSLDRKVPSDGYVVGNVTYISARANRIKYNATPDELRKVLAFLEGATTIEST